MKTKNLFCFISVLIVLILVSGCSGESIQLFVSPVGSDENPGTLEQPFATLDRARDEVRKLIKEDLSSDVIVNLRAGTYYLSKTLVLGLKDSAPKGHTITYRSYLDEKAVLSSGVNVTGWERVTGELEGLPEVAKGKVWMADIPEGMGRFLTLYKGDIRLPRARTEGFVPDTDIHPKNNPSKDLDKYTLYYPKGTLRDWENLEDVELIIIPSFPWWMNILPLASVDEKKRIARTAIPGTTYLCDMVMYARGGKGYEKTTWIENVLEGMDTPGEWVINTRKGKIYLWPREGVPGDNIFAPALRELVKVEGINDDKGDGDIPVQGIRFSGLTFTQADRGVWKDGDKGIQHDWEMLDKDNAMLRFRGAMNCHVTYCHFFNAGGNAIRLDLYAQKISVENCLFNNLGQSAVMMIGYGPGTKDVNKNNRVYNNHIHHCGEIYWHSQMITMSQSGHNYIGHNYLHHIPRKAICACGVRYHWLTAKDKNTRECVSMIRWDEIGDAKTHDDMVPFLHSRNNIIEYNEIHHALEKLGDGSAINLSGGGNDNIVRYNYIHDCPARNPSSAIRMDGSQIKTLVENNIIVNMSVAGISPKGDNTIRNNFIIQVCNIKKYGIIRGLGRCDGLSNLEYNIIYNVHPDKLFYNYHLIDKYSQEEFAQKTIDNNLYFCPDNDEDQWPDLALLKSKGADQHSVYADPMFADWKNRDFTLKPKSPALKLGIKQIDISTAGLTDQFPAEWR